MSALRNVTVGGLLAETASRYPRGVAVEYGCYWMAYETLQARVDTLAKALLAYGVRGGDRVAVWEDDRPETLVCFYAVVSVGAVAVLLNTHLKSEEAGAQLADTKTGLLLYGDGCGGSRLLQTVRRLPPLPGLKQRLYIGSGENGPLSGLEQLADAGRFVSDEALRAAKTAVKPQDCAAILFTSGSMGAGKGVMTSHYSRANNAILQAADLQATSGDRFLVALPMFHCFSLSANILAAMSVGARVVFPRSRRTQCLLETASRHRCTVFHGVPTLFHALMTRPDFERYDLSSVRIGLVGGSYTDPEQMRRFREVFRYELLPSLGMTEATAGITVARPGDPEAVKLTTVGHFMEHVEGRVVDPATGAPLCTGQTGEIAIRGYCVMQGYCGLPEQTRKAVDAEGFLHTGDLGYLDADGNLHYTGRIKPIIIRGGENIHPAEIEACLLADGRIAQACVVGIPDAHYGEATCACVVCADRSMKKDQVRELVAGRLARYKVPDHVLLFDDLPVGVKGGVRREEVRGMAVRQLEGEGSR